MAESEAKPSGGAPEGGTPGAPSGSTTGERITTTGPSPTSPVGPKGQTENRSGLRPSGRRRITKGEKARIRKKREEKKEAKRIALSYEELARKRAKEEEENKKEEIPQVEGKWEKIEYSSTEEVKSETSNKTTFDHLKEESTEEQKSCRRHFSGECNGKRRT